MMYRPTHAGITRTAQALLIACWAACASPTLAEPTVAGTEYLGPFTGLGAPLHPDNTEPRPARYFGTDLGFSYEHGGALQFLFGDTMAEPGGERIDLHNGELYDDMYGVIPLADWPDPALIVPGNLPLIRLGQHPGSSELIAIDPGYVFDDLKTPEAGFSNGTDEFAVLLLAKPEACLSDADCDNGMHCDAGLGHWGPPPSEPVGTTLACVDGNPGCSADTLVGLTGEPVAGSGLCIDPTSSIHADTGPGRVAAYAIRQRIGIRDRTQPWKYRKLRDWMTNKFLNATVATVECLPMAGEDGAADYSLARGAGGCRRVLLWGRPGFTGVGARNRFMGLYLAYADMPSAPGFRFDLHYFVGLDGSGRPKYSALESEAVPLDLDPDKDGRQPFEQHDIVNHMSIVWVEALRKWVMFYGGGIDAVPKPSIGLVRCGLLEIFAGPECTDVDTGNGAVRMRTADHPWGPWSAPQDVVVGGRYEEPGSGQFGPGGALFHPACDDPACAPSTAISVWQDTGHGWFYGINIIEQWIRPAGEGVDVIWNASTWDPYRVVLFRTRINH